MLDDAEGSGWVEANPRTAPHVGFFCSWGSSACPEPRFSLTPDTGHGPPAGEEESLHTICRKGNPHLASSHKSPSTGSRGKNLPGSLHSAKRALLGVKRMNLGPGWRGLAAQPPSTPYSGQSSKGLKSQEEQTGQGLVPLTCHHVREI